LLSEGGNHQLSDIIGEITIRHSQVAAAAKLWLREQLYDKKWWAQKELNGSSR
jgi:hypothetical protein